MPSREMSGFSLPGLYGCEAVAGEVIGEAGKGKGKREEGRKNSLTLDAESSLAVPVRHIRDDDTVTDSKVAPGHHLDVVHRGAAEADGHEVGFAAILRHLEQ